ncbi:hypothetical protein F511_39738 [Dorcoceras hygrometricum]|uniref:Uncharacterized protein n=1 Tax=Dorcoceras hygrometricum TaxID=472368 RepID=A0A2Z7D5X5_9LAMI|nr:hypothetical protein F511_39738 [Dorcoceras hygrometricum]
MAMRRHFQERERKTPKAIQQTPPLSLLPSPLPPTAIGICSDHLGEEIPSVIFVGFLVQTGEGVEILVVDRIRRRSNRSTVEVPITSMELVGARRLDAIKEIQSQAEASSRKIMYQSQATVPCIQSTKISAEDEFSRSDKPAAKQLTIYESWMSTAELNSNGESDKTQSTLKMERING